MEKLRGLLKNKLLSASAAYTFGNILIKGINFATLPLFSRIMTTEDFGIFNVFISYEAILFVIIGLAIHGSIQSANLEFKGKINNYTSSVTIIYFVSLITLFAGALVFKKQVYSLIQFDFYTTACLLLYSFGSSLMLLYNARVSLDYDYKSFLKVSIFSSVGNIVLSIILIFTIFDSNRGYGRITGVTITAVCLSIYILVYFYKKSRISISRSYLTFAIKYSLPIVPHGLAQVLLAQFDRIMIRNYLGLSAAGLYSLAGNIQLILNVITTSIATVWATWFFKNIDKTNKEKIQIRASQICYAFLALPIIMVSFSPELVFVLGGEAYHQSVYAAIPLIVVGYILFIYNIIVQAEYYMKKTVYIMTGTMIAAIINVITNSIFIKRYGFVAAAYTTLFSYLCYLILHSLISRKCITFHVIPVADYIRNFGMLVILSAVSLAFIDRIWIRVIAFVLCMVLYLIVAKKGVFSNESSFFKRRV